MWKPYFCFNLLKKNVAKGISTRIPSNIAYNKHHTTKNLDSSLTDKTMTQITKMPLIEQWNTEAKIHAYT